MPPLWDFETVEQAVAVKQKEHNMQYTDHLPCFCSPPFWFVFGLFR